MMIIDSLLILKHTVVTYHAVVTYNLQVTLTEVQTVNIIVKASETTGLSDEDIFLDVCQVFGSFPITSFGEVESKTFVHGGVNGWDMFSGNHSRIWRRSSSTISWYDFSKLWT